MYVVHLLQSSYVIWCTYILYVWFVYVPSTLMATYSYLRKFWFGFIEWKIKVQCWEFFENQMIRSFGCIKENWIRLDLYSKKYISYYSVIEIVFCNTNIYVTHVKIIFYSFFFSFIRESINGCLVHNLYSIHIVSTHNSCFQWDPCVHITHYILLITFFY